MDSDVHVFPAWGQRLSFPENPDLFGKLESLPASARDEAHDFAHFQDDVLLPSPLVAVDGVNVVVKTVRHSFLPAVCVERAYITTILVLVYIAKAPTQ